MCLPSLLFTEFLASLLINNVAASHTLADVATAMPPTTPSCIVSARKDNREEMGSRTMRSRSLTEVFCLVGVFES